MPAEEFRGHFVRVTLGGPVEQRQLLDRLLAQSAHVAGHDIDDEGRLVAFLEEGRGEIDLFAALNAAGLYPLETYFQDTPDFGGHRAC